MYVATEAIHFATPESRAVLMAAGLAQASLAHLFGAQISVGLLLGGVLMFTVLEQAVDAATAEATARGLGEEAVAEVARIARGEAHGRISNWLAAYVVVVIAIAFVAIMVLFADCAWCAWRDRWRAKHHH